MIIFDNYTTVLILFFASIAISIGFNNSNYKYSLRIKISLIFLRFTSIFLIGIILLSPILEISTVKKIKPKSVILVDNSASINLSNLNPELLIQKLNLIQSRLSNLGYDVESLVFDNKLNSIDSLSLKGNRTNLFSAIQSVLDSRSFENLQNIILLTDGNYNEGNNPLFINNFNYTEIYPILIGDTSTIPDIKIEQVDYNPVMISNEICEVQVQLSTIKAKNCQVNLKLIDIDNNFKVLDQAKLNLKPNSNYYSFQFKLSNLPIGNHHYKVVVDSLENERYTINNQFDFFIDVIDGIKNIEILSTFPHPDISALNQILRTNKSFKIKTTIQSSNLNFSPESDLLILYQLPTLNFNNSSIIENAFKQRKSILFILGSQFDYIKFNSLQKLFLISYNDNDNINLLPFLNSNFSKFYLTDNAKLILNKLPSLSSSNFLVKNLSETSVFLSSKNPRTNIDLSLFSVSTFNEKYIGLIAAENFWKWRIYNYNLNKTTVETDELFAKFINLLLVKSEKKQLVTNMATNNFSENTPLLIYSSTYNDLFQFVKPESITCKIESNNGISFSNNMILQDKIYTFKSSNLKLGEYTYTIDANINNKKFVNKGKFSVYADNIESYFLPSNIEDMNSLAIKNYGSLFYLENYEGLVQKLALKKKTEKLITESKKLRPNDLFLLLIFILVIISIEWLWRKYLGLH